MRHNALLFLCISIAAQGIGFAAGDWVMSRIPHELVGILIPGVIALTITSLLNLPRSWRIVNALFPAALYILFTLNVPSWTFLAVLLFFATLHLPALWTRVPYYPTPKEIYNGILQELPSDKDFTFIDIGCGMGDLLRYLSMHRPNGTFYGVEIALFPYLMSKLKSVGQRNLHVSFRSFWKLNLGDYDYIYAFLSPAPMEALWGKLKMEKAAGALFLSNSFETPGTPIRVLGTEGKGTIIYIYT